MNPDYDRPFVPDNGTPANWIDPDTCLPRRNTDVLLRRYGQYAPQVGWYSVATNTFYIYGIKEDTSPTIAGSHPVYDVTAWAPIPQAL